MVVAGIRVYRDSLCQLLQAHPSIAAAASANCVDEALMLFGSVPADALIVDVSAPAGMEAARRTRTCTSRESPIGSPRTRSTAGRA